jgi:hypothetical protein
MSQASIEFRYESFRFVWLRLDVDCGKAEVFRFLDAIWSSCSLDRLITCFPLCDVDVDNVSGFRVLGKHR